MSKRTFLEKYRGGIIFVTTLKGITYYDWICSNYKVDQLTTKSLPKLKASVDKVINLISND